MRTLQHRVEAHLPQAAAALAPQVQAAQPAPAPKPAAPTPSTAASRAQQQAQQPKPTPKLNNFGFDMSEIEQLAKNIEANASKNKNSGGDYDGNIDPKGIKLSKM